jgi:hypothetical protein
MLCVTQPLVHVMACIWGHSAAVIHARIYVYKLYRSVVGCRFNHSIDELVLPNARLFVQKPWPLPLLRSLEKQKIP